MKENFLSGFVSIIGSPNVGKSTLINAFIGQKITITSSKPQTTRTIIQGVLTREDYQIIFIDTPGIHTPKNKLSEFMVKVAYQAINEVDCIILMLDASKKSFKKDIAILDKLAGYNCKIIAAINKVDIADKEDIDKLIDMLKGYDFVENIICTSAVTSQGLSDLEKEIKKHLVKGPQYFPEDMVTDQPERVLCSEFIREAAIELLQEEVPYGLGVDIDKIQMRKDGTLYDVWATIYCERDGHKGILIGKNGSMLKRIGIKARKEIEWLFGAKVNLQLWVKVNSDWRNKTSALNMLGYNQE